MAEGLGARRAAAHILDAVLGQHRTMAEILGDPAGPLAELSLPERARAQRLALTTLRHLGNADRLLAPHLRKTPPLSVANVLRLAVVELAEGAPAHGVVNAAVEIVRRGKRTGHLAGLVNAVLRKLPEGNPFAGLAPPHLPRWLRQPMVHAYGRDAVLAIEAIHLRTPPLDLTPRPDAAVLPDGLRLPNGTIRLADPGQVSTLPGFASGEWWVQDAAAAMAVPLLAPRPGERVLDICAAPGGKTLQLAAAGAEVTALDVSPQRMARVTENLARTRLQARTVVADALTWDAETGFDAILLDAPCSASGTIRRHPDLPFVKDGTELAALIALQAALLDRAITMLRPGGRIVFCTCSLLPEEGEDQLAAALARHPGLRVDLPALPWIEPGWVTAAGGLRLRPDAWAETGGMDGFFMARLSVSGQKA